MNWSRMILLTASAIILFHLTPTASHAKDLKVLSSFSETLIFSREILTPFVEKVEKLSGDSLSLKVIGPEAVGAFEQLQPVQAGAFDILFTHPNYHVGTTGIGESIEALNSDPKKRRELGMFEFIDNHYQTKNLKLLAIPSTGTKGVRIFLKDPVSQEGDLKGLVIRSAPAGQPMVKKLGGSPVVMPGGEIYTALQRGAVDGVVWPQLGAKDLKWYEVAGYYLEPPFGTVGFILLMNLDSWNALTPVEQEYLAKAGEELELDSISRFDSMVEDEYNFLRENGMKPTKLRGTLEEHIEDYWNEGVWEIVIKNSGATGEKFREFALENGMTK